jgi:hypothetical protein
MFEVNGEYANRRGKYKVLAIDGQTMSVRYEDGTEADLKIHIQERIWENIVAEMEPKSARRAGRGPKKGSVAGARHYVKVLNVAPGEELAFPGWEERVVLVPEQPEGQEIHKGDRLIYFSQEAMTFFAVATVTGEPFTANPKKYTYAIAAPDATFFQIDIDADTGTLEKGVTLDSVELESCPDFSNAPVALEAFCPITEDDFELLAELLAEISEDDEDTLDEDEEDFEDEDDE